MDLTFEFIKEWGPGQSPIITHTADDSITMFYQEDGVLKARVGDYNEADPNETDFSEPIIVSTDTVPHLVEYTKAPGGQHWVQWKTGTKHRVALYPESPKIMKEAFFKGLLLGLQIRQIVTLKGAPLGEIAKLVPEQFKDENNNIDFWNGYTIGVLL